jgi:Mrp family chromosome partitioning ATPase
LSRNFDLLQRVAKEAQGWSRAVAKPLQARTYEMRPIPDAHALSQEELVRLVRTVFLAPGENSPHVVVFTGADPEAGCSSICLGAAEALAAQMAGTVCVVDSNLRHPSLHMGCGVDRQRGLSEVLLEPGPVQDCIRKLPGENLWFLSCGLANTRSAGIMNASRLAACVEALRQEFTYVLLDSPCANLYSDAISLGQCADGIILIVSANRTRRECARRAKENLQAAGARLLGAVLNKRTYPIPQAIYDRL